MGYPWQTSLRHLASPTVFSQPSLEGRAISLAAQPPAGFQGSLRGAKAAVPGAI
jgi:hypothetical protein